MNRAKELLKAGEIAAALPQLQIACDQQPDRDCVHRLAAVLNDAGEPEQAEAQLKKFLSDGHDGKGEALDLMRLRTKTGDFRGAADAATRLLTPPYVLGDEIFDIARAFIFVGETDRATKLLEKQPNDSDVLPLRALLEMARNRPAKAKAFLALADERYPGDAFTLYLLGVVCHEMGDETGAAHAWAKAAELPDAPGEAAIELARIRAARGKPDEAMALLNRTPKEYQATPIYWQAVAVAEAKRKNPVAVALSKGYELFHGGDPWAAEKIWRETLPKATGEDIRELCAALHNSAYKRQDAEAALQWADEGLRRFPDDPYFRKRRAEVLLGQNRLPEAEREARKLQERVSSSLAGAEGGRVSPVEAADLLCRVALDSGKPEWFQESVARYAKLAPDAAYPLLYQAEWQAQQGRAPENLQKTLDFYQQAAAKDPKDPDAQAQIGLLLADLKRPKEAETVLLHALTLWPRVRDGAPHARLVQIYQREGKAAEAAYHAAEYQRLRQIKEGWPTLLKALRQDRPVADWLALGNAALLRRENWVALCAFHRAVQLSPKNTAAWRGLAATYKRQGWFLPAFEASQRAELRDNR